MNILRFSTCELCDFFQPSYFHKLYRTKMIFPESNFNTRAMNWEYGKIPNFFPKFNTYIVLIDINVRTY